MKKTIATLTLALVSSLVSAQDQKEASPEQAIKAGRLEIEGKNWDFGFIPRGAKVTHYYLLKNVGNDTLKITNVRKSCGCTYAPLGKDILYPGDTTQLAVTFNSGSYQGPVSKSVYVESNDPIQPFIDITFSATVAIPANALTFDPMMLNLDTLRTLPGKAVLKVTNLDSSAITFSILESPAPFASLKSKRKKVLPGKEMEIEVQVKNPPGGEFNTSFTLICDDAKKTRYTIPIHGYCMLPK
jgi:hypothetical protein